jgi:hypothetical protein
MMTAPSIVTRYVELHCEALRSEAQRDRLAAPCQPNASLTTRRAWRTAASLLASRFPGALAGGQATGGEVPSSRGAL